MRCLCIAKCIWDGRVPSQLQFLLFVYSFPSSTREGDRDIVFFVERRGWIDGMEI